MRTNKKSIVAWAVLILTSALVIYGCRSMPPSQTPSISEEALPEDTHYIQPPEDAVAITHEVEGFEDCTGCHNAGGMDEGATVVDEEHYCSACHEMAQPLHFDHGSPPNESCTLCHRPE